MRHRASLRDVPNAGSRYAATSSRRVVEDGDRGWRWVRSRTPYAVAPRTRPTTAALRWCPTPRLCGWGSSGSALVVPGHRALARRTASSMTSR
jgi:hypothetical protein